MVEDDHSDAIWRNQSALARLGIARRRGGNEDERDRAAREQEPDHAGPPDDALQPGDVVAVHRDTAPGHAVEETPSAHDRSRFR